MKWEIVCPDDRVRHYPYRDIEDAQEDAISAAKDCRLGYEEPSALELSMPACPGGVHMVRACPSPDRGPEPSPPGPLDRFLSALLGRDITQEQGGHGIGCLCTSCMKRREEQLAKPLPPDSLGGMIRELHRKKRKRMN